MNMVLPQKTPDARVEKIIKLAVMAVGGQGGGTASHKARQRARTRGKASKNKRGNGHGHEPTRGKKRGNGHGSEATRAKINEPTGTKPRQQ